MRAGQQWEVCEARTGRRPSGSIAREQGLGDARLPGHRPRHRRRKLMGLARSAASPRSSKYTEQGPR